MVCCVMLFNSPEFLLLFLPVLLGSFAVLEAIGSNPRTKIAVMLTASLLFYAWWDFRYLSLLVLSFLFNFGAALLIARQLNTHRRALLFAAAIAVDLGALFWFKYADFALRNFARLTGDSTFELGIVLPLGISFFTFTQIAFLADVHSGRAREFNLSRYALFVTYFPHLIAGPIIHHAEMMPQFRRIRLSWLNLAIGVTCFIIGLAKKDLLADNLAPIATKIFDAAEHTRAISLFDAWMGALAYTLQLYFDFSGYTDMAIGLSAMFGVRLPLNFNSPYKSASIIEFWQRWHMTLSRFLRDYLYIPLGGNRKGEPRRYVNLLVTMFLGGIWHGAGWTYMLWGAIHGVMLAGNHLWRRIWPPTPARYRIWTRGVAWGITFLAVVAAWVPFRARTLSATVTLWRSMFAEPLRLPTVWFRHFGALASQLPRWLLTDSDSLLDPRLALPLLLFALLLALVFPNTQQFMSQYPAALGAETASATWHSWRPAWHWMVTISVIATACLLGLFQPSVFIYFQF